MLQTVLLALLMTTTSINQEPALVWDDFHAPAYPRTAQIAHILGPVTIEFTLEPNNTVALKKSTGHPLLVPAAEDSIKASRLHCAHCEQKAESFTVVFDFTFADHSCSEAENNPPYSAKLDSANHVSIVAEPVCTSDPAVRYKKVRSFRCLYLWKCEMVPEKD